MFETLYETWAGIWLWPVPALSYSEEENMDTTDRVGGESLPVELLCYIDLRRRELAVDRAVADAKAGRYLALAQEIAQGNISFANAVLRCRGVW